MDRNKIDEIQIGIEASMAITSRIFSKWFLSSADKQLLNDLITARIGMRAAIKVLEDE